MIEIRRITVDDWQVWRRLRQGALGESPIAFGSSLANWTGEGDTEERWRDRLREVPVNVGPTSTGLTWACAVSPQSRTVSPN